VLPLACLAHLAAQRFRSHKQFSPRFETNYEFSRCQLDRVRVRVRRCVVRHALRVALPQHHLSDDSKDVVKLGMGLVATMSALVLGLLVASAKSSYDAQSSALTEMSSKVVLLDRVLAHYGPETKEARNLLRGTIADSLDRRWPKDRAGSSQVEAPSGSGEILIDKVQDLSPQDDRQRALQAQAVSIVMGLG